MNKLLHELSVHQIELEIQNEELRTAKLRSDEIQQHLSQLYHQAPVGYVSLNGLAMIVEANQTFSQLLAIPLEQMQGKSITQFMPEAEKNAFLVRYRSFYHQPINKEIETCLLTARGKLIEVRLDGRISQQTLTNTQEQEVLLISVTDVSEINKTQKLLLEAKEEAERANQAKSMFLSQMSHNLRTPLNAIIGFAQILDLYQTVPLDSEQCEYIQNILDAGQHLLELINDVLNFAKIEAGRIEIASDNVSVHSLLRQSIGLIEPVAAQRGVSIHYQEVHHALMLLADSVRLKEILLNLLSNAIKYNHKGGSIDVYCVVSHQRCRICVKDTGIGLSQEQQQRLFQPFERLGAETSNIEGTGIGLVICKRLIEAMNGEIGVESLQGEGSNFWIELPLSHEQSNQLIATPRKEANVKAKCNRVLYIEDNEVKCELRANS
jgi:PAS domain S-box-containing protein